MNTSPNKIAVNLSALQYNLSRIREFVGQDAKIMGMVKSDAYGHGLIPVARELEKLRIDAFGVDYVSEAVKLRTEAIKRPIVLLLGISSALEARQVIEYDLTPVVYDLESALLLSEEGAKSGKTVTVFLKIDTGMGRLGIDFRQTAPFLRHLISMKGLRIEGLFSHLSSADHEDTDFTKTQVRHFREAISAARGLGLELTMNSLANSAGIIRHKEALFDLVRPGIMLYGGFPCPDFVNPPALKPLMAFWSSVIQVREVEQGTPISYGRTFYTERPQKLAIISAGYGEGLSRALSNKGQVLIRGRKAPIIGSVCMNLTIADVTPIEEVKKGDAVLFMGEHQGKKITAEDMACWANTISYEIFCSLGGRNAREYTYEREIG